MRLILVRHGDAYAGFHGVVAGERGCRGLTPLGRRQAQALRDELATSGRVQADVLLASVIPRAIETAEIIAPGFGLAAFERRCDLCEVHTGDADGLEWVEYHERFGGFDMQDEPDRIFAPGGESWNGFHARVGAAVEGIAERHPGETVVAVCHAGVIQASVRVLFDIPHPGPGTRLQPSNTGMTTWDRDEETGRWTLRTFNDDGHLAGVDPEEPDSAAGPHLLDGAVG